MNNSPDDLIASHRQLKLNFGPEVYNRNLTIKLVN